MKILVNTYNDVRDSIVASVEAGNCDWRSIFHAVKSRHPRLSPLTVRSILQLMIDNHVIVRRQSIMVEEYEMVTA